MFSDVVAEFQAALPGTESFKRVRVQCEALIRSQPEQATVCFVIGEFCRAYVLFYEDQEVRPAFAQTIKAQLLGYMLNLDAALQSDDPASLLQALNQVTQAYAGDRGLI